MVVINRVKVLPIAKMARIKISAFLALNTFTSLLHKRIRMVIVGRRIILAIQVRAYSRDRSGRCTRFE